MGISLVVLGLIFNFIGSFVLILVSLFGKWHQTRYDKSWTKRYWWEGRRPFYKNTQTHKWHFKWNHIVIVEGFIPPKHMWNSIGFLFIAFGFLLQLLYLT